MYTEGGRDWSDGAVTQGPPRTTGCHQKLGERHGIDSPSEPWEQYQPCGYLDIRRRVPRTVSKYISVVLSYPLCVTLLG